MAYLLYRTVAGLVYHARVTAYAAALYRERRNALALAYQRTASRAGWENVTAVKNGAILNLQNNELSRPAPRLAEGAQMLADFIAGVEANDKAA